MDVAVDGAEEISAVDVAGGQSALEKRETVGKEESRASQYLTYASLVL